MNKYEKILELDKIIQKISEQVILEDNVDKLNELVLSDSLEEIELMLNEVEEASILRQRLGRISILFKSSVKKSIEKTMKMGVLSTDELLQIGKFLDGLKGLYLYLDELTNYQINAPLFKEKVYKIDYPKSLNMEIKHIINQFGEINDDASSELKDIRKRIKDHEKGIQSKLSEIISKNACKLSESLVSIRNDRYVIPVRVEYKNVLKGIIHDVSSSGETVFIEPIAIFEMNNNLNRLYEKENEEIYRILKLISSEIGKIGDFLLEYYEIFLDLDLIFGKAEYCNIINAKKPKVNKDGIVELYQCYHPLLNVEKIITNNVIIGNDYKGIIITGPNTGGKTVLLKTVGLLSLMVKAGLLIPANENSNINIFDNVFADIGDEQSIEQNLSTFSSHMTNVINILDNITTNSLVLIDELGSGTDPVEGSSLAISIIDDIINRDCLLITTSHYSELKIYAYNNDKIINASVEFDIKTLKPTYKLLIGVPGQSNALKISKLLGLHDSIIEAANNYAHNNDNDINKVLDKLVNQSKELDVRLNNLKDKEDDYNQKLIDINKEYEKAIERKNEILKQAEAKSKEIIANSNQKINEILAELDEMKLREVKLHEVSNVKGKLKKLKEDSNYVEEVIPEVTEFKEKMSVFVENYGCYGIIIKENKNNKFDVQIGNATITVDKKFLKISKQNNVKVTATPRKTQVFAPKKTVSSSLDLRGKRYEEAKDMIEKYLDDALYAGLHQVSIIHGYGTGTIRELVHKILKAYSKDIESYRYGGAGEGGQGVTVVTLNK